MKEIRLGITSSYIDDHGLEKGVEMMVRHGYNSLDYQGLVSTERETMSLAETEFERRLRCEAIFFEKNGLTVSQVHGPWRYPPKDLSEQDRAERYDAFCKAVRGTAYLQSKYVVVHPLMPFGADSSENPDELYKINFDFYSRLTEYADSYGVTVCLENMPFLHLPLSSTKSIADFVRKVGANNFKVCLDTGHANVFGIKMSQAIDEIGADLLAVLHIHDNNGTGDHHLNPFCGTIDWEDFGTALSKISFDGTLSLETAAAKSDNAELNELAQKELFLKLLRIRSYITEY